MYNLKINNKEYTHDKNLKLMDYLREELRLTSVKNGCKQGACGACMVIVDGQAKKACVLTLEKVSGKEIITLEGIDSKEKQIYADCYAKAGAVQCGFCTPGMVISTKALLDKVKNPTDEEIRKAIRQNICRCTGYLKIIEAIKMISKSFSKEIVQDQNVKIGSNLKRVDAESKALGEAIYADDIFLEGMLHGAIRIADVPRGKLVSINIEKASALAGVRKIITHQDIPGENYQGYIFHDWPTFVEVGTEVRYIGDVLAAVAADTQEIALAAAKLIEVEIEEYEAVTDPIKALEDNSAKVHEKGNLLSKTHVERGSVKEALANSKYTVKETFLTPHTEHAFIEPESVVTYYEGEVLTVISASQSVHHDHEALTGILNLAHDKIRVKSVNIGGGFGGKEDLSIQHFSAMLTYYTKAPVKITLTRDQSLKIHPKRHLMVVKIEVGCDDMGYLTAVDAKIYADTGAYASLGTAVLERACTHAAGPYKIKNINLEGYCVYTNNPPSGAFRGFGVPQSNFARETCIDLLADKVGIDKWQIRYQNAVQPGDFLPTGGLCEDDVALKETLESVKDVYYENIDKMIGIACGHKNSGIGVGLPDFGRANLIVEKGKVVIYTSAARIGQGLATTMIQIAGEVIGDYPIEMADSDSVLTPDAGATTASRQTLFTGEATRRAAVKLKEELATTTIDKLNGKQFSGEYNGVTDSLESDAEHPRNHISYGFATQVVILDENNKVGKVIASHDVGKAINPLNVVGQIEGGVVMSLGYALTEKYKLEKGYLKSKFATLGLLKSVDIPEIESIIIEKSKSELTFGAKGIGEICSVPTAAAVASAYRKLTGKLETELPLKNTPYSK